MQHCTKEQLIAFEEGIKALWEAGELPYLLHLCGGNEDQLIEIFKEIQPGDWVFSGHRSHYHALLSGMDPAVLLEKIVRGDSMFVFGRPGEVPANLGEKYVPGHCGLAGPQVNFLTSSVLAGTCCIAAGVAWKLKADGGLKMEDGRRAPRVWCFLGDGAEDEGHFYEAARYVAGHDLPCTFIIEDNNRSVDTDCETRRGGSIKVWNGDGTYDAEFLWPDCVQRYEYTPTYPHAGSGCKQKIEFRRERVEGLKG